MADKTGFPQIPARVWWGVRDLINSRPKMKFDDSNLAATLNVQLAAARQYLGELKRIGMLDDQGAATELGERWRHDESYEAVVDELLAISYPEGLINIAPPGSADRAAVEKWFAHSGLGTGTAKNKAGTYLMIANDRPGETKIRAAPQRSDKQESSTKKSVAKPVRRDVKEDTPERKKPLQGSFPLNVNVQIHISADASGDRIESIFAAMRKYLHDDAA